jgi:hypothetical protein
MPNIIVGGESSSPINIHTDDVCSSSVGSATQTRLSSARARVFWLPSSAYADGWGTTRDDAKESPFRRTTTAIQRSGVHRMPIVRRDHSQSTSTDEED